MLEKVSSPNTNITVGICAYNEEKNIEKLLKVLLKDKAIDEIIIVASGCTDKTVSISTKIAETNNKVRVISESSRNGKSVAVNIVIKEAKGSIIVLESADTIPLKDSIKNLIKPFKCPEVGITGAHVIPNNDISTFMGFTSHMIWDLHHKISMKSPKCGEVIAFRNVFFRIPPTTAVDEASIETIVTAQGYKMVYVESAIIENKGPENISDFIKQRRRIYYGHAKLKSLMGYTVPTTNVINTFSILLKSGYMKNPKTYAAVGLEAYARLLAKRDFASKKQDHKVWEQIKSTKDLNAKVQK